MKALYPTVADVDSGTHQGGDTCFVSSGASCGSDFGIVQTATDPDGNKHPVCCPNGDMPTSCTCTFHPLSSQATRAGTDPLIQGAETANAPAARPAMMMRSSSQLPPAILVVRRVCVARARSTPSSTASLVIASIWQTSRHRARAIIPLFSHTMQANRRVIVSTTRSDPGAARTIRRRRSRIASG